MIRPGKGSGQKGASKGDPSLRARSARVAQDDRCARSFETDKGRNEEWWVGEDIGLSRDISRDALNDSAVDRPPGYRQHEQAADGHDRRESVDAEIGRVRAIDDPADRP